MSEPDPDPAQDLLVRMSREGVIAQTARPDPERVLRGDPVHRTWNIESHDGLFAGLWHSTRGAWEVQYDEWEYFRILEGHSVLTDAEGRRHDLRAGDAMVIRPGFTGIWEVVAPTLKDYVIRT